MKFPRRRFLHLAASTAALSSSRVAWAQSYPSRPVNVIVGFGPGSSADIFARLVGQWLSEHLDQPFVIDNRPGAGGNIAAEAVVRTAPDGYTILWLTAGNAYNATLYHDLHFDIIRDIAPVAGVIRSPAVMELNPSVPAKTVSEFIAYAKANPGKIDMASTGNGTVQHIAGELFKTMAGVDMLHVPYRTSAQALVDLISGQTQVEFDILSSSIGHIKAGELRPLAVTTATRSELLPGVPALAEFLPGYEASSWQGVGVPKNTSAEIIETLNKGINAALVDPKIQARIFDFGAAPMPMAPVEFKQFLADETEKWGKVIRAAGIKLE